MSHPYHGLNELREMFLSFFESKGHLRLPSFSLVPQNDKSILLINAGMTPMKPWFKGEEEPPRRRVCTCQKCIRTGDIENVGKTARHGTYFEMLGNFSFGDYFKHEAIAWSWEFLTEVVGLEPDRLYPSIYLDDDEAFDIWNKEVGIPAERIFRFGKEDNFWEHGSGPCGPCSEIYYDRGPEYGCGKPGCTVGCDCDRYIEVWNIVFSQFDNDGEGHYTELKQNLFLCNLDESRPTVWYDLQQLFLREYPRKEGEGMKLENVVTRMGIPLERPFHDALSDTLYTADLCRMLDLRAGLAAYPSEEDTLRQSLCPTPGDYRDFRVFRGYLDQSMWKLDPVIGTMACPVCGTALQPDDVWLKKGSSGWYTLSQCPVCKGRGGEAGRGVFQKYRMSRRDGLHWAFARCVQMPDDASLVRWKKQKAQYLERQRLKAERQAAEAEAARHIF